MNFYTKLEKIGIFIENLLFNTYWAKITKDSADKRAEKYRSTKTVGGKGSFLHKEKELLMIAVP